MDDPIACIESGALQLYRLASTAAKYEHDLAKIARIWETVAQAYDAYAYAISEVCSQDPNFQSLHAKLLELQKKCTVLKELHS